MFSYLPLNRVKIPINEPIADKFHALDLSRLKSDPQHPHAFIVKFEKDFGKQKKSREDKDSSGKNIFSNNTEYLVYDLAWQTYDSYKMKLAIKVTDLPVVMTSNKFFSVPGLEFKVEIHDEKNNHIFFAGEFNQADFLNAVKGILEPLSSEIALTKKSDTIFDLEVPFQNGNEAIKYTIKFFEIMSLKNNIEISEIEMTKHYLKEFLKLNENINLNVYNAYTLLVLSFILANQIIEDKFYSAIGIFQLAMPGIDKVQVKKVYNHFVASVFGMNYVKDAAQVIEETNVPSVTPLATKKIK